MKVGNFISACTFQATSQQLQLSAGRLKNIVTSLFALLHSTPDVPKGSANISNKAICHNYIYMFFFLKNHLFYFKLSDGILEIPFGPIQLLTRFQFLYPPKLVLFFGLALYSDGASCFCLVDCILIWNQNNAHDLSLSKE